MNVEIQHLLKEFRRIGDADLVRRAINIAAETCYDDAVAQCELELGVYLAGQQEHEDAIGYLGSAIAFFRTVEPSLKLATALYWLEGAESMHEDREYDTSPIREAYTIFSAEGANYSAASCCCTLGGVAKRSGDFADGRQWYNTATGLYEDSQTWTGLARTYRLLAELEIDAGNTHAARVAISSAQRKIDSQPQGLESVKAEQRFIEKVRACLPANAR